MAKDSPQTSEELSQRLEREPDVAMNWHLLGMAYARESRVNDLLALCDRAAPRFGNRIRFFHNIAIDLSQNLDWRVFDRLAQDIPPDRLERAVAVYYKGCELIVAGRHTEALGIFQEFKRLAIPRHREYPLKEDTNFNILFRQGTLPETPEETARILKESSTHRRPAHTVHVQAEESSGAFVVATSADKRYFQRFAEELFRGYADLGLSEPLHVHLIGPDDQCFALFERLRERHPDLNLGLTSEPEESWHNPVYFTCARFAAVGCLLDLYAATILLMDADSLPTSHPSRFLAGLDGDHFACIRTTRDEPASVYQAGIMVFPDTPTTLDFADKVALFALAKIHMPPVLTWMLDQAALMSVLTLLLETDPEFRFANLMDTAPEVMRDPLVALAGEAEKGSLMNA